MSWRYMAARQRLDCGEDLWTIREVCDDTSWTVSDITPGGSTHSELREILRMMTFDIEHQDFLDLDAGVVAHRGAVGWLASNPPECGESTSKCAAIERRLASVRPVNETPEGLAELRRLAEAATAAEARVAELTAERDALAAKIERVADELARIADESQHEDWDSPRVRSIVGRIQRALDGEADR